MRLKSEQYNGQTVRFREIIYMGERFVDALGYDGQVIGEGRTKEEAFEQAKLALR